MFLSVMGSIRFDVNCLGPGSLQAEVPACKDRLFHRNLLDAWGVHQRRDSE